VNLTAIMGPTGSGKSALAEMLADATGAQLVSADAFQVYRGFDIGTNKPADTSRYELIDICDPTQSYGAGEFVRDSLAVLERCFAAGQDVIVVGGTGFYIRALFEEYAEMAGLPDPAIRASIEERFQTEGLQPLVDELLAKDPDTKVDLRNPVRVRRALEKLAQPSAVIQIKLPPFRKMKFGLRLPKPLLDQRIEKRLDQMLSMGWEREVRLIIDRGIPVDAPAMRAIGYQSILKSAEGLIGPEEARERTLVETRQYAKRQMSWLRSEPGLTWIDAPNGASDDLDAMKMLCDGIVHRMREV